MSGKIIARITFVVIMSSYLTACRGQVHEDPYVTAFRTIRSSVVLLIVDDNTYGTASVVKVRPKALGL